jgi:signal transduction histidine kinase/DNA-binding response OmpR family regulator
VQPIVIVAELLLVVVFVATLRQYIERRDPVSRDVVLVFSGLAILLFIEAWDRLAGGTPDLARRAATALFALQPVFALHLVSLVHRVPRQMLVGSAAVIGAFAALIVLAPELPAGATVAALVAFVAIEALAATFLVAAARARVGPGAVRMLIAAVSTGLIAVAFAVILIGAALGQLAGSEAASNASGPLAAGVGLAAVLGYLVAFVPPRPLRSLWQAGTAMQYAHRLIDVTGEPVEAIWKSLTRLAAGAVGGAAAVVVAGPDRTAIGATSGFEASSDERQVEQAELAELLTAVETRPETPVAEAGALARRLAGPTKAQFVSVVRLPAAQPEESATVVILSPYRSLFHESDLEAIATLGAQTAIVAERRVVLAEQEALGERLRATVDALRAASEAKSDFLASMSHELRTPLSAILGFSDLMRREPAEAGNVAVPLEWVEHVHRGGEHLLALINDVLDLAKVEAGRLELDRQPLDIGQLGAEVVSGLRPLADRKRLELASAIGDVEISADRGRLRQILYNLLSNAIKYTPEGGSVRVETELRGGETRISVVDTGIGIDPSDHAAVFEEFRQVGAAGERQPGTGLGLALTRRLVEAHDGRIELRSARGEGSTFTVILPGGRDRAADTATAPSPAPELEVIATADAGAAAAAAHVAAGAGGNGANPTVLVIEDDPSVVRLLREYLEPAGYRVEAATTGEAGLEAMRTEPPVAVVLDVLLPGIDGWEVLRRAKNDGRLRAIPVVILTVLDERDVGLALGAADYLVKPVDRDALLSSLGRYTFSTKARERPIRVLAIDDEPAALDLLRDTLEPEGFEVVVAAGGREALDQAASTDFDLVICDLVMPDVDGFEVVVALKRDPRTAPVPILVCTAHDLTEADKGRLNGKILGIVSKGADAMDGLRSWLGVAVGAGG